MRSPNEKARGKVPFKFFKRTVANRRGSSYVTAGILHPDGKHVALFGDPDITTNLVRSIIRDLNKTRRANGFSWEAL